MANQKNKNTPKKVSKQTKKQKEYQEMYKRYCLATTIILGTILITYICYLLFIDITDKIYNTSYLEKNNLVKETINISDYNISNDGDYFIYISYRGQKDIYNLEKNLKELIKKYNLQDKLYYIDVTDKLGNKELLQEINTTLKLEDFQVKQVPTIIYFNKNNEVLRNNIITREDNNLIESADFQKLLDINGY